MTILDINEDDCDPFESWSKSSDADAALERARAAVLRLGTEDVPTFEELDAAAETFADEQYRLLTQFAQLREHGSPEEIAAAAAEYDAAVLAAGSIFDARNTELEDGPTYGDAPEFDDDPALAAAEAVEHDRFEEYCLYLAEQGQSADQGFELDRAIE